MGQSFQLPRRTECISGNIKVYFHVLWFIITKTTKSIGVMTLPNGNIFHVTGPFVRGIHRSPVDVDSPHKGQWRGAWMFSLIRAWTNGWANHLDAGDLRRHRAQYYVGMELFIMEERKAFIIQSIPYDWWWLSDSWRNDGISTQLNGANITFASWDVVFAYFHNRKTILLVF